LGSPWTLRHGNMKILCQEVAGMEKHLVLVGGGHAHLTALLNLARYAERGHRITLISPFPYHYYSGMGPGMLSGIYRPREVRFHVKKMAEDRGGVFVEDRVVRIAPRNRTLFLQGGKPVPYDVASFNTGSEVPTAPLTSDPGENVIPVKPVKNLLRARRLIPQNLKKDMQIIVIGGGPAGVEIAGNAWRLVKENGGEAAITLIAGRKLLGGFPEKVRRLTFQSLSSRGIQVVEANYVKEVKKNDIVLSEGGLLPFDFSFLAVGIRPSSLFRDSGIPTGEDGGLRVNGYLQSIAYPELFGGGDCIGLSGYSLAKVGVYAVRQNPILFHNLLAALEGGKMQTFTPQKNYLLIFNMGNRRGILWRKNFACGGRPAFLLKDYIDRKFMRKFQVSGERAEPDEIG
jgi:NADH dehydrogenase FAD-containing subunit